MEKFEHQITVCVALPFLIRLKDGIYKCKLGKNAFLLNLETVKNDLINGKTGIASDDQKEYGIIIEASSGKLKEAIGMQVPGTLLQYSLARIKFWKEVRNDSDEESEKIRNLRLAHRFLNQFINIYRFVTSDIEVHPLTYREFSEVRGGQTLQISTICPQKGIFTTGSIFGVSGVTTPPLPFGDNEHHRITKMLLEGVEPPIVDLLLLNSRSFLRDGERRLGVIELGTAFDIDVEQVTLNMLKIRGELTAKMKERLENNSTRRIACEILQSIINEDIINSAPYTKWDNDFRPLRNRVVHDAYDPTPEQAEAALQVIESLHAFLAIVTPKT